MGNHSIEVSKTKYMSCSVCRVSSKEILPEHELFLIRISDRYPNSFVNHNFRLCPKCKDELIEKLSNA